MPAPRFSVVIPAYNAVATIAATVRSVLAQSEPGFELIVVDDGSADETPDLVAELARSDARLELIRQRNRGTAGARNTGIARARGELVSFLDNDDLWMPRYLERMAEVLDANPDAGFAYTDAWLLYDEHNRIRNRTSFEHYDPVPPDADAGELLRRLIEVNFVMSSVTVRRSVLEETGGFATEIRGADDWDLWLRILAAGYTARPAEGVLLIQRGHAGSQSRDVPMMYENVIRVLERVGTEYPVSAETRLLAERRLEEWERRLAIERGRGPSSLARFAWRRLQRVYHRLLPGRDWLLEPPPEVAAAFPDLAATYGRPASSSS